MEFITNEQIKGLLTEEEKTGRDYIDYNGVQEIDGFLYSMWNDKKRGKVYAVREIRTVHMGFNDSPQEKINELCDVINREGVARASWGVTGRTCHMELAEELKGKMPAYSFEIGYNYECKITK